MSVISCGKEGAHAATETIGVTAERGLDGQVVAAVDRTARRQVGPDIFSIGQVLTEPYETGNVAARLVALGKTATVSSG